MESVSLVFAFGAAWVRNCEPPFGGAAEEYAGRAPRSAASLLPFREVTEVGATGEGYIALATDSECK